MYSHSTMQLRLNPRWQKVDERARRKYGVGFVEYGKRRVEEGASYGEIATELSSRSDQIPISSIYYQLRRHGLRIQKRVITLTE